MKILKRIRSVGVYERWMLVCVAGATLVRLVLIYFNWPYTDSDEGNMGVLALHVAFQGDHPVWFYGGNYLGPLEGYLAAPLFRLFGSSLFLLRLPLVFFFVIFLVSMYYLVRLLYNDRKYALAAMVLPGLGSPDVLFLQLRASGEYPELEMFVALMCLLAVGLALTTARWQRSGVGAKWGRAGLYALLGALIGQALWVDLLAGPFVLGLGLLLLCFCWRELLRWPGLSLVVGFVVGGFPLLYYNFTSPWSQNSWFVLRNLQASGEAQLLAAHLTWVDKFAGSFFVALPMAISGGWNCAPAVFPPAAAGTASVPCMLAQGGWSAGYLLLWLFVTCAALVAIWRLVHSRVARLKQFGGADEETRRGLIRQSGRLVVLAGAGLTLLLYTNSPSPAVASDTSFRYLTCLLLVLPIMLWPLWRGLSASRRSAKWWLQAALLLLVVAILTTGTIRALLQMPATQARYQVQQELVQDLEQAGTTRLYSDYWTCNILIYLSNEKIICSAVGPNMSPAQDRYLPYRLIVRATPHPGYIFTAGSPQAQIMQQRAVANPGHYRVYRFFEYVVYQETEK
ncbi:MAG TPA: hypothetical protein VF458_01270 [Ktedonobacteraceae bacterium]